MRSENEAQPLRRDEKDFSSHPEDGSEILSQSTYCAKESKKKESVKL